MNQRRYWMAKVAALALVAAVGAAVMALDGAGRPMTDTRLGVPAASAASYGRSHETTRADVVHAVERGQVEDIPEPSAVCRLAPECEMNSDCDARCGVGLGRCVHSRCPVRICRCR